jgi:putative transposase
MTDDLNNRTENGVDVSDALKEQLDAYFNNSRSNVKVVDVLSSLNISSLIDSVVHKHSTYSKSALLRLYLYRKIHHIRNYYVLSSHLDTDLSKLGFLKLPTKKCFNNFLLKFDRSLLDFLSEIILNYCVDNNVSDIKIFDVYVKKRKEIARYDDKFEEAIKMVKRFVYPNVEIKIRHNASITTMDLLDVLTFMASRNDFCYNATKSYMRHHPNKKIPKGDTILYHLSKLDEDSIRKVFDKVFDVMFNFTKKEYRIFKNRKLNIAFDVHEIPFYGDKNLHFVSGGKFQNGTAYFYKFLTCSIVVAGRRFTLDAQPLLPLDNLTKVMDKMIQRIKRKIHIGIAYLDRGFDRSEIHNLLQRSNVKYLMPKIKSDTVKQWMDKAEGAKAYTVNGFKIGDNTKVNLVFVDDEDGVKRVFVTNMRIGTTIAHKLCYLYKQRWGIETAYRQMDKDFKPRTTTTNFNLRLLYFLFTVALYNFWILINIVVSIRLYGHIKEKPIITAKLFMETLLTLKKDVG